MKKIIAPFVRIIFIIIFIIVVALFIVEQLIQLTLTIAIPLIWILTGKGVNDIWNISFVKWLVKNKITPFLEKIGIGEML